MKKCCAGIVFEYGKYCPQLFIFSWKI